ncbi:MAG: ferritin [Bacteroidales bacterium]|jgi:ferritin
MITKIIEKAINEQIRKEEDSSRIYLSMASWSQVNGFQGAAEWLYAQSDEERMHELKLIHYLNDRGGTAQLADLEIPTTKFKSLLDVFQQVLKHEEYISASINEIYAISIKQNDYSTGNFLQWYITEQIEEESTAKAVLDQIQLAGEEKGGLFHMDKELAALAAKKRASQLAAATTNAGI